jgi:hypothetical protein
MRSESWQARLQGSRDPSDSSITLTVILVGKQTRKAVIIEAFLFYVQTVKVRGNDSLIIGTVDNAIKIAELSARGQQ